MKPVQGAAACIVVALGLLAAGCNVFESRKSMEPPEKVAKVNHFDQALALERSGEFEKAVTEYRVATRETPDDSRAWVNLGRLYARAGQESAAVGCWRKAVEVNPRDAQAWNLLGGVSMRERDFQGALANYRKAIDASPNEPDFQYNAAIACRSMKMDADAAKYYSRWLQLSPSAAGEDAAEARRFLEARGDE